MRRTILIVDDNAACAEPLQIALETWAGIDVQVVSSAREALRILGDRPECIFAVITDLRMPSVSGFELLEAIQRNEALRPVPVVIVSGDSDPSLPARALNGGAAGFFTKPYSPLEVKRHLEQLLI